MEKFIVTVRYIDGKVRESDPKDFEGMMEYCKGLHTNRFGKVYWGASCDGIVSFTVEECVCVPKSRAI